MRSAIGKAIVASSAAILLAVVISTQVGNAETDDGTAGTEPVPAIDGRDNRKLPDRVKACPPAGAPQTFATYRLGERFEGLPRTDTNRPCQEVSSATDARANFVEHIYGDCNPKGESCVLPLAVQSYPACERTRADYQAASGSLGRKDLKIRGVPAAMFDDGTRLELYAGETTIVIFGFQGSDQLLRAARALRGEWRASSVEATERLPRPKAGAVEGTLAC